MKWKHFIDSHKGVTALAIVGLIALYDQWENPTAWIYLGLHGSYGLLWVLKSAVFPDKSWERRAKLWFGVLVLWGGLTAYWLAPFLIVSENIRAEPWYLGMCVAVYGFGVFWHFGADMQKHMWLRLRPGELLTEGLWARCRNPNYFGELLIYVSFALLAQHWAPALVLALFVAFVWWPNMRRKDRSLSRYPEFAEYRARSKLFIPGVF